MLFSPYCREFNSLQKRYTALLHTTNTFSEIKSYGRRESWRSKFIWHQEWETDNFIWRQGWETEKLFGAKWQLRQILFGSQRVKIGNVEKLIPNLNNKTNYVVHYENLKLYESLGLKITKIHRGIKFEESAWLEKYINLETKLR